MINRLRVILPPDSVVIAIFVIFSIAEAPFVFLEWKIQQPLDVPRPSWLILRVIAFSYGFWRVSHFHPAYNAEYRAWLERTPWDYNRPLPGGPISLVWEDALPLAGLAIMGAFLGPIEPYRAIALFLFGYLLALLIQSFGTGAWTKVFGYLIAFGIILAIRLWPDFKLTLACLCGFYLVGQIDLRLILKQFRENFWLPTAKLDRSHDPEEIECGWPFDQLKPPLKPGPEISKLDGLMIGLFAGWFLFAIEALFSDRGHQLFVVQKGFTMMIGIMATTRTFQYCGGYAPPISLLGRIRTFRWIIPGYDKIFLAPICILLVGVLAMDRFRPPGLDDLIVLPIALAVAVTVAIDTGPTLLNWRLTGQHRLTIAGSKVSGEFVKVG